MNTQAVIGATFFVLVLNAFLTVAIGVERAVTGCDDRQDCILQEYDEISKEVEK